MRQVLCILLIFAFSGSLLAQDILIVNKGTKVLEDGFWVSKDQMKKFRQINEEKKLVVKQKLKMEDLRLVQERRINTLQDSSDKYRNQFIWSEKMSFWKTTGGFILGAIVTGMLAKGLVESK